MARRRVLATQLPPAALAHAHFSPLSHTQFEKAVNEYSSLLRRSSIAGGAGADPAARARHAELLLARCAAWSALSEQLRSIPAAQVGGPRGWYFG